MERDSVRHFHYVAVLAGCLAGSLWLEFLLRTRVLRRWRRLAFIVPAVVAVFSIWDWYAISQGHWFFDESQVLGVRVPGNIPLDEIFFFMVIPICAILSFEAVRSARPDWWKK